MHQFQFRPPFKLLGSTKPVPVIRYCLIFVITASASAQLPSWESVTAWSIVLQSCHRTNIFRVIMIPRQPDAMSPVDVRGRMHTRKWVDRRESYVVNLDWGILGKPDLLISGVHYIESPKLATTRERVAPHLISHSNHSSYFTFVTILKDIVVNTTYKIRMTFIFVFYNLL